MEKMDDYDMGPSRDEDYLDPIPGEKIPGSKDDYVRTSPKLVKNLTNAHNRLVTRVEKLERCMKQHCQSCPKRMVCITENAK